MIVLLAVHSQHEMPTVPFLARSQQAGDALHAADARPSYPSLWRTWNSRCVVSLAAQQPHGGEDRQSSAAGPTKELIRGSPVPIVARDDARSSPATEPLPPPGAVRKFTMNQFQHEFGPCHTLSAPAGPLRQRFSVESTETIPMRGPHPRLVVEPAFAAPAAAGAPATLGTGGWRPVTGRFSLDSSSSAPTPSRPRWDDKQHGSTTSTLPWARKPLSTLDNLPLADKTLAVKFTESADETG